MFSYQEDSEELYVGGTDFVLRLDVNDYHIIEVGVTGPANSEPHIFFPFGLLKLLFLSPTAHPIL